MSRSGPTSDATFPEGRTPLDRRVRRLVRVDDMQVSVVTYVEGMKLDITANRITIVYDGDLEIEVDPGRNVGGIRTIGDLTVRLPTISGDLVAGGKLEVHGDVADGGRLQGREVILDPEAPGKQTVKCKVISAEDRIVIGAGNIVADAMIAPRISVDAQATGRVTIIESRNELGPTKIKGGLSLAEYEETFGNAEAFVAENGLVPLPDGPDEVEPEAEPEPEAPPAEDEEDLHPKLVEALDRILACYDAEDLPLPVEQLIALIETRDYDALRVNIDSVWNELLKHHQKKKIRAHHQVTHAFSLIHMLVQG